MEKNKREMEHFRKWAADKPPLFVIAAFLIGTFPKYYMELAESINSGKWLKNQVAFPSLQTWLKLYRNPKRIGRAIYELLLSMPNVSSYTKYLGQILKGTKEFSKLPHEKKEEEWAKIQPDEWKLIFDDARRFWNDLLEFLIEDFYRESNSEKIETVPSNFLSKPEMIFFIRVVVPCYGLYGTHPFNLLKQAEIGDKKSLERLIRLDKAIIFDRKISQIVYQAQFDKKQATISIIKTAFRSNPRAKNDIKKIKYFFGGLLAHIGVLIAKNTPSLAPKVGAQAIRKLFDAIACDTTLESIDTDFGEKITPETFEKNIQRARKIWNIYLPVDKK